MSYAPPLVQNAKMISNMRTRPGRTSGVPTVHAGMDLSSGNGKPVVCVQDGVVETVSQDARQAQGLGGYGNAVVINQGDGFWTLYGHMSATYVTAGQRVTAGTMIGRIGNTSNGKFSPVTGMTREQWRAADPSDPARRKVMGPHLHLERRHAAPGGASPYLGTWAGRGYGVLTVDPKPWLEAAGIVIARNLSMSVAPGSQMDRARATWSALAGTGVGIDPVIDDATDHGFEMYDELWDEADSNLYVFLGVSAIVAVTGAALLIYKTG